jgi:hypothetical protein
MKKLCADGYKISSVDAHVLAEYLLFTPLEWTQKALASMIYKSQTLIIRKYFDLYKSKQSGMISTEKAIIIPAILAMTEFKKFDYEIPIPALIRKEVPSIEIWPDGFDIQDYVYDALYGFYKDPEAHLKFFITEKIVNTRKEFIKQYTQIKMQTETPIEKEEEDFINQIVSEPGYKTRAEEEVEV